MSLSTGTIIRSAVEGDIDGLELVVGDCELFPPSMLRDMIAPSLNSACDSEFWLVAEEDTGASKVAAFAYCKQEMMTEGVWNLLALGARKDSRRKVRPIEPHKHYVLVCDQYVIVQ